MNTITIKMGAVGFHASRSGPRGFFQNLRGVPKHLLRKHASWLASEAGIEGHLIAESLPPSRKKGKNKNGRRQTHS